LPPIRSQAFDSTYTAAPEVYGGQPYGPSADVYSLGRLISYMKYKVGWA